MIVGWLGLSNANIKFVPARKRSAKKISNTILRARRWIENFPPLTMGFQKHLPSLMIDCRCVRRKSSWFEVAKESSHTVTAPKASQYHNETTVKRLHQRY
jgi:hypothetical protein